MNNLTMKKILSWFDNNGFDLEGIHTAGIDDLDEYIDALEYTKECYPSDSDLCDEGITKINELKIIFICGLSTPIIEDN